MGPVYRFKAKLWIYNSEGSWYFLTVPSKYTDEIRRFTAHKKGFGAQKVNVNVKGVEWETSVFPDSKSSSYLLPVKKDIRKKAGIVADDEIEVSITLLNI